MFKNQIYKKALYPAPDELEMKILLHAAEKINFSEDTDNSLMDYAGWVPFLGFFLLLKDLIKGNRFTISPEFGI